ncbi:Ig-like domain-containing protein, partial [Candidatus Zixiibacteriota bacterium]
LADSILVDILVLESGNQAPVLTEIGAKSTTEGATLSFGCLGDDPDGDAVMLYAEDLPTNATFTDYGNGSGLFYFMPDYTQSGGYTVRFIATDGALADTEMVSITVLEAGNQWPAFLADPPDAQLLAGNTFTSRLEASDPDGDPLTLTAIDVPLNAAFVDSGNGIGGFEFTPDMGQGGSAFTVRFVVSDGALADTVEATYTILPYVIGDCNADNSIDPLDVTILMNYIYRSGPEPTPALAVGDLNCDDSVDPTDMAIMVNFVYRQGPPFPVSCP